MAFRCRRLSIVAGRIRGTVARIRALRIRAAMTPAPAMHRETFALAAAVVVPVLGAVLRRLRLRLAAGDERRQAADIVVAEVGLRLLLRLEVLLRRLWPAVLRLRLLRTIGRLSAVRLLLRLRRLRLLLEILLWLKILLRLEALRNLRRLPIAFATFVSHAAGIVAAGLLHRLRLVVRVLLAELLLRRGNQAEVVLGVLMVRLGGDVVTGR